MLLLGGPAVAAENAASDASAARTTKKTLLRLPATLPDRMATEHSDKDGNAVMAPMDRDLGSTAATSFVDAFESRRFRFFSVEGIESLDDSGRIREVAAWVAGHAKEWACEEMAELQAAQSLEGAPPECTEELRARVEAPDTDAVLRSVFAYRTRLHSFRRGGCKQVELRRVENGRQVVYYEQACDLGADAAVDLWQFDFRDPQNPRLLQPGPIATLGLPAVAGALFGLGSGHGQARDSGEAYALAARSLGRSLAGALSVELRKLAPFRLVSPVSDNRIGRGLSGPVVLDLGRKEDLKVGFGFDVVQTGIDGTQRRVGYVKVASVGDNRTGPEGEAARRAGRPRYSDGEVIANEAIAGGTQVSEHPMLGLDFQPFFKTGMVAQNIAGSTTTQTMGGGIEIEGDVSGVTSLQEFWVSGHVAFELAALAGGPVGGSTLKGLEVELGLHKLTYLRRLQLGLGLFGGWAPVMLPAVADAGLPEGYWGGGFGGRVALSAALFVVPEFQLGVTAGYRYFTEPEKLVKKDKDGQDLPEFPLAGTGWKLSPTGPVATAFVTVAF